MSEMITIPRLESKGVILPKADSSQPRLLRGGNSFELAQAGMPAERFSNGVIFAEVDTGHGVRHCMIDARSVDYKPNPV